MILKEGQESREAKEGRAENEGAADILMLHGWGTHAGIWKKVSSELEAKTEASALALDFPGYGSLSELTCPDQLDDLVEYVLERAPSRSIWAGWSLGGMVAMRAAVLAPERVSALFLICSTSKFVSSPDWPWGTDINLFENFVEGLDQDYGRNLRRFLLLQAGDNRLARELSRPIAEIVASSPKPSSATLLNGLKLLKHIDLRDQLSQLKVPVHLFSGQLDRICHPKASNWIAEQVNGTLNEIRCGHCPLLSHPEELTQQLSALAKLVCETSK